MTNRHVSYVCPQCHWSLDEQDDTALLRQALEALENSAVKHPQQIEPRNAAIAALRERLGEEQ
jgi:hypothetical protein